MLRKPVSAFFCSLLFPALIAALSLDLHHENTYYGRSDKFDTTLHRDNFYEALNFTVQNPGSSGLSFSSDMGIVNNKPGGMPKQYEIRSTSLDWSNSALGLGCSVGRQFVHSFAREAGYLDGVSAEYDAGKRFAVSAFAGMDAPPRYTDSILNPGLFKADPKALTAGVFGTVRFMKATEFGIGASADRQVGDDRPIRAAASLSSKVARNVDIRGNVRYEVTDKALEVYNLAGRYFPSDKIMIGAHVGGQGKVIDSVNYYERMVLNRYNEAGLSLGYSPARSISFLGGYSVRLFSNDSLDNLADAAVIYKGASLRFSLESGAHGSGVELTPGYVFTMATNATIGASVQFNRYSYLMDLPGEWHNAYTAVAFMRWYAPWFAPAVTLVVEPQVEYLVNDYYTRDVRVLFITRLNLHKFWQSGQPQQAGNK
jgi:hypothetical protein